MNNAPNRPVPLSISSGTLFRAAMAVVIFFSVMKLAPLFCMIFLSVLIGTCLQGICELAKKWGIPSWISHALVSACVFVVVGIILGVLVPSIVEQITDFAQHMPEYRSSLEHMIASSDLRHFVHGKLSEVPAQVTSTSSSTEALRVGGITISALYQFGILLILSLYLMVDGRRTYNSLLRLIKKYFTLSISKRFEDTATEIKQVVFAYVLGQAITCAFVAIYTYAVNRILNVPGALTLAAIACLCDLVPVVGFISSLAISCIVAFSVSATTASEVAILYLIYTLVENYIIVPKVYGEAMKLSRLVVLLSILIGGEIGGVMGMIMVLPIVGSWHAIEKYWIEPRYAGRPIEDT